MSEKDCIRSLRRVLIHLNIAHGILSRIERTEFLDLDSAEACDIIKSRLEGAIGWTNLAIKWEKGSEEVKGGEE